MVVERDAVAGIDPQQWITVIVRRDDLCRISVQDDVVRDDLAFAGGLVNLGIAVVVEPVRVERIDVDQVTRVGVAVSSIEY